MKAHYIIFYTAASYIITAA